MMRKFACILILAVVFQTALFSGDYGMTSFPVLMMENYGARQLSISGSGVALTGDLNNANVNPAGISRIDRIGFSTMKLAWMFDTAFYNFSAVYPLGEKGASGVLGLSAVLFDINEFDTVIDGSSSGSSAGGDYLIGVTYANNIFNYFGKKTGDRIHLDLGITVKFARSALADYSSSALAFDFGLNYSFRMPALGEPGKQDTMSIGTAVRNAGFVLKDFTDSGETRIPWYFNFGFHYRFLVTKRHTVGFLTALNKPSDNDVMLASGLEYGYRDTIFIRAGYKFLGREYETFTFGFGLNFEVSDRLAFRFDYANIDLAGFGKSDTFSLSVLF